MITPDSAPQKQYQIVIKDSIWFLRTSARKTHPDQEVENFHFPGWNSPLIFGNDNPINIEYCSGNGFWIAAKAEENPSINWVAVEYKFSRACKIWGQLKRKGLKNLFIINGEALHATSKYIPSNSINGIYINFPDPWPKRKHIKFRLINPTFAAEMARILKPSATITFVTDDPSYSDWTLDIILSTPELSSQFPAPHYVTEMAGYGNSFF